MTDRLAEVSVISHDGPVRDHNDDSVVVPGLLVPVAATLVFTHIDGPYPKPQPLPEKSKPSSAWAAGFAIRAVAAGLHCPASTGRFVLAMTIGSIAGTLAGALILGIVPTSY